MAAGLCSWGRRRLVPRPWRDRDARKGCGAPPRVPPARLPPEEEPLRDAHRGDPGHALPAPAVPSPADAPEGPLAGPGAASPQDRVPTPTREPRGLRAVREVTPKVPGQHLGLPRPAQGHPSPHGCRQRPDPVTRPPALGPGARDTGGGAPGLSGHSWGPPWRECCQSASGSRCPPSRTALWPLESHPPTDPPACDGRATSGDRAPAAPLEEGALRGCAWGLPSASGDTARTARDAPLRPGLPQTTVPTRRGEVVRPALQLACEAPLPIAVTRKARQREAGQEARALAPPAGTPPATPVSTRHSAAPAPGPQPWPRGVAEGPACHRQDTRPRTDAPGMELAGVLSGVTLDLRIVRKDGHLDATDSSVHERGLHSLGSSSLSPEFCSFPH